MSILYGNRDGTFQAPVGITTGVNDPNAVVVGDFNGDGRPDIAVANEGDETVSVLLNTGNDVSGRATFAPAPGSPFSLAPSSNGPIDGMTTANLTGHGNVDLVLSTSPTSEGSGMCGTSDCVQVLTNVDDRSGNFNAVAAYSVGGEGQVAAADVRGTGVDDVLVPMDVTNGTGTGGF
ncbi:MAG: VCBS repeat-containing protein [Solirubrobacterales bacterium]|nr:VCBS repeat-containing protein [Solirubrobacterales bacterium]